jgi:DNA polymerase III subunit alpha
MNYVPLQIKTSYSLLSSLINIKDLIKKAKQYSITSLAITDINSMHYVMEFYHECINNNIKPIIGLELHIDNYKLLMYAKDYKGYQNLCKITTIKSERNITYVDLEKYKDNIVVIIPYASKAIYNDIKNIYHDLYFGYSNLDERKDLLNNNNDKLVFINDVLYLIKEDSAYLDYVYAIRDSKKISDIEDRFIDNYNYLLDSKEILTMANIKDINNTIIICDMCNIEFKNQDLLPIYNTDVNANDYLNDLAKKGLNKRLSNNIDSIYSDRLQYELTIIEKMGFANYFLVVYDFIKYAKNKQILVGPGRGSAAGSLVSYCLGITDVDPLKYNLFFERFLNPERITMPDIDIDFPDVYREEVINYVINKYGSKKIAGIITFGTMAAKQVIRDVGRVLDIPLKQIDYVSSMIDPKDSLTKVYSSNNKFKEFINSDDSLKKLYKIALKLEAMPRHTSIHAAGIVMANVDLDEVLPLVKSANGYITSYSMEYLEELGLLKVDFLGLKNLTTIMNIINNIKNHEKINIDFNNIPMDDKEALNIFNKVNTEGIFQFETLGMKNFLKKLQPTHFEDIVAATALFRPGPMDNIDSYVKRKYNKEPIDYIHPDLINVLSTTYGVIIYQEQIMQIASIMANYSLGEADVLRRAMSKKKLEVLEAERETFIKRSINKGYTDIIAKKVFELILKFANYGFNRAHAVAYAIIAYKMAYLKAHYPKYFMSCLLTSVIGSEAKTKEYIYECKANNVNILKPDINLSYSNHIVTDLGIRFSLATIHNVGVNACSSIIKEREKGLYLDFIDFVSRTYGKSINRKTIESLIDASCFSSFGQNKKTLHQNLESIINYAELVNNLDKSLVDKPELELVQEYSKEELMNRELEVFGFYLSMHPITKYRNDHKDIIELIAIKDYFNKDVNLLVMIDNIKVIKTKNNEEMAFILGTDELAKVDITLFPKIYDQYKDLTKGMIIKVFGKVEKRLSSYQIIVSKIAVLE